MLDLKETNLTAGANEVSGTAVNPAERKVVTCNNPFTIRRQTESCENEAFPISRTKKKTQSVILNIGVSGMVDR